MATRKILYSPGFGAGWVTWHSGTHEEKQFMLTYGPIIEAIEEANKIDKKMQGKIPSWQDDEFWKVIKIHAQKENGKKELCFEGPLPYFLVKPMQQFAEDWGKNFPKSDLPYLGGACNLMIKEVSGPIRINEYDGNESIEYPEDGEWFM